MSYPDSLGHQALKFKQHRPSGYRQKVTEFSSHFIQGSHLGDAEPWLWEKILFTFTILSFIWEIGMIIHWVAVNVKCDNICNLQIISSVVEWCHPPLSCVLWSHWKQLLEGGVWNSLWSVFIGPALREVIFTVQTGLNSPYCVILSVKDSCTEIEWNKVATSQLLALVSEFEDALMCMRQKDRYFIGGGAWRKT